jgi:hypothetical protein
MRETELPEGPASTDPPLLDVLTDLQRREPIFHRRELGTTRADFEAITASDFWEVGASGDIYSREQVWASLERRYADTDHWAGDSFEGVRHWKTEVVIGGLEMLSGRGKKEYAKEAQAVAATGEDGLPAAIATETNGAAEEALVAM